MGFLSNLKNKLTGGGAKVSLEIENPNRQNSFNVTVSASVADSDMEIKKVYLFIKSVEKATVRNVKVMRFDGSGTEEKDVTGEYEPVPQNEVVIAGAQTLKAGQQYKWTYEINMQGAQPTYNGVYAKHEWYFLAGIDAPGNDPDSGWLLVNLG